MIGEISVDGVYIPSLLVFVCVAVIATGLLSRLLSLVGFYRLVVHRPVTDLAIFFLVHRTLGTTHMRLTLDTAHTRALLLALMRWSVTAVLVVAATLVAVRLWDR